jgi:molecular chaperone GrpE
MNKKEKSNNRDSEHMNKSGGNVQDMEETAEYKKQGAKEPGAALRKGIKERLETEELEEEIKLLRKELESYKKVEGDYIDRIKRLQADYDNYRKRNLKEHLEHIERANKDLIEKLLPIIDNFEMAIEAGKKLKKEDDEFLKGVEMIYEKLMELLERENVRVIDPVGEEFNPEVCEAAATEAVEGVDEGNILEVIKKGYMINDYLIRPAVVKVCKKK